MNLSRVIAPIAWLPVAAVLGFGAVGCDKPAEPGPGPTRAAPAKDEFKTEDLVVGTGPEAHADSKIRVHYVGTLKNGTQFDSTRENDEPSEFTLGTGGVIAGWDKGIPGMKVGGKRRLTIPYDLAYGDEGHEPNIPPFATLIFEIELVGVE